MIYEFPKSRPKIDPKITEPTGQARYITVMLDHRTGTHQILNWPTLPHADCIAICQSMPPSEKHTVRHILLMHPGHY